MASAIIQGQVKTMFKVVNAVRPGGCVGSAQGDRN